MLFLIKREDENGDWLPFGEPVECEKNEDAQRIVEELQAEHGRCFSADAIDE